SAASASGSGAGAPRAASTFARVAATPARAWARRGAPFAAGGVFFKGPPPAFARAGLGGAGGGARGGPRGGGGGGGPARPGGGGGPAGPGRRGVRSHAGSLPPPCTEGDARRAVHG